MGLKPLVVLLVISLCVIEARFLQKKAKQARSFGNHLLRNRLDGLKSEPEERSSGFVDYYVDYSTYDSHICQLYWDFDDEWWFPYVFPHLYYDACTTEYCEGIFVDKGELDYCITEAVNDDGLTMDIFKAEACVCDESLYPPCSSDFDRGLEKKANDYTEVLLDEIHECFENATNTGFQNIVNIYGFMECVCMNDLYPCPDEFFTTDYYMLDCHPEAYWDLSSTTGTVARGKQPSNREKIPSGKVDLPSNHQSNGKTPLSGRNQALTNGKQRSPGGASTSDRVMALLKELRQLQQSEQ